MSLLKSRETLLQNDLRLVPSSQSAVVVFVQSERLEAILYMDSIAFLGLKSSSDKKGQSYNNSPSPKRKLEEWTVEYIVDRLFFEMLEFFF
jgi:hypothetical protein